MTDQRDLVLPLAEERLTVATNTVESAVVRITTRVEEREELVQQTLQRSNVAVERIPVGREVDEAPRTREENGIIIVPVFEEIIVVSTRYLIKEELHIRRKDSVEDVQSSVTLRSVVADVERISTSQTTPET